MKSKIEHIQEGLG